MSLDFSISLCFTCEHKRICKHYKYFRDNEDIAVHIKECDSFKDKNNQSKVNSVTTPLNPADIVSKPNSAEMPGILTQPRTYPPLRREPDPFNPIKSTFGTGGMSTSTTNVTPVEISKVVCDRCKKEVLATDIDNCVECGRAVCKDCGVMALNANGVPEFTCEKCWSGTPDPDPNAEPEKVTITYGEVNSSWELDDFEEKKPKKESKEEVKEENDESDKQVETKRPNKKSKK